MTKRFLLLLLLLVPVSAYAQQPVVVTDVQQTVTVDGTVNIQIAGQDPLAGVATATLQSAATANGNGTLLTVNGYDKVVLTVNCDSCSGGTTVNFDASEDGTNFNNNILAQRLVASGTAMELAGSTTTSGVTIWMVPAGGYQHLRARISAYSAGTVTVTGRAVFGDAAFKTAINEDVAHVSGEPLVPIATRRIDTAASSAGTSGDHATLNTDSTGRLWTSGAVVEDAGETAGDALIAAGTVRRDTAASSAGTTGDNATLNTDASGLLWVRQLDPCSGTAKTYLAVSISSATTTEITPSLAGASTNYYVCSINLVTAAANNVALVDDDSDNCGSVTSGLAGGTTAATGWNFAANGGLAIGTGNGAVMKTNGTNRVLCLVTSAATQLSGTIVVVAAP